MTEEATTTPQVRTFCNGQIRSVAQDLAEFYVKAKRVVTVFGARELADAIPETEDEIDDGAAADGRPIITGNDVHAIIGLAAEFCQTYEANTSAKLIAVAKVAPNL